MIFEAELRTPGGHFRIDGGGVTWEADDENAPPYLWGWQTLDLAQLYFEHLLKTIYAAQEARRGR